MAHGCENCGKPAEKKCAGCSKIWYCSRGCQEYHWIEHLLKCNVRREITSADHLALAVRKNLLPSDPQTLTDYGFRRAVNADTQMKLLGVYIGLMEGLKVKARTVHRWKTNGTLLPEIKAQFESLPPSARSTYYSWFLQNEWVLDGNYMTQAQKDAQFTRAAWLYAGGDPSTSDVEIQRTVLKWHPSKYACLNMCAMMLHRFHPSPMDNIWVPFGFCTCDENSELELGGMYQDLLEKCSFGEFYNAYKSSKLVDLFTSKGWGPHLQKYPFLVDVLKVSPNSLTVWDLKQAVINDSEGNRTMILPQICNDYGYINCDSLAEENELMAAYLEFFKRPDANPPALHKACMEGRIFDYLSAFVKLKNKKTLKRLMKNRFTKP